MTPSYELARAPCTADTFFGFSFIIVPFFTLLGQLAYKIPVTKINKLYMPLIVYAIMGSILILITNEVSFAFYKHFLSLGWVTP